ncbi:MAG: hydroxymethylglutaryl-CoA reductase, degradative, partial [Pseudomonadales bacterium]
MGSESSRNTNDKSGVSRIPEFYKMSVRDRLRAVHERGLLTKEDFRSLTSGEHTLKVGTADKMIENVIGVMGLPVGLALNFLINGRDLVIPVVVEEPSIVAALSSAAKTSRLGGGFKASATDPILIGQVQIVDIDDPERARETLLEHRDDILNLANSLHPKMVARGGGAKDLEVHCHGGNGDVPVMVVLHLLVDTRDAMGANLVNTMCEGVASLVENLTEGKVFLRILSNLTDRALAFAEVTIPVANLEGRGYSGEQVRDGIILANDFALTDPYRAATHNKGIMNGVDAAAIASGNDWRALEAAAHAYAARDGQYRALTQWRRNAEGDLVGSIEIPMKVGIVGGPLESNPTVALNHRLLGVKSATELAGIMASVGLAQNFGALRALVTEGIQQGHMTLHARGVASAAGAGPEVFETVVEQLIESGDIKVWRAEQIIADLESPTAVSAQYTEEDSPRQVAHGKIILLGEHAVVYGRHAIAAPIPLAVEARVVDERDGVQLMIPRWGIEQRIRPLDEHPQGFDRTLDLILEALALSGRSMRIEVFPKVPRAMGLGGSAAVAVAIIRAIDAHFELKLTDEDVNAL